MNQLFLFFKFFLDIEAEKVYHNSYKNSMKYMESMDFRVDSLEDTRYEEKE